MRCKSFSERSANNNTLVVIIARDEGAQMSRSISKPGDALQLASLSDVGGKLFRRPRLSPSTVEGDP
ncbi:MAG: hypothetical protein M3R65_11585 [Gemmatimonadota bacterium]|nr:hypothetical protein [Gemmatimonadota bacterium]